MRKFNIKLNGTVYNVEVEEITEGASAPEAAPVAVPVQKIPEQKAEKPVFDVAGAQNVSAPMPGNIINVLAEVGEVVKSGQAVVVLEAMKMENEIYAPADGQIIDIKVKKGDSVNTGDILFSIK